MWFFCLYNVEIIFSLHLFGCFKVMGRSAYYKVSWNRLEISRFCGLE